MYYESIEDILTEQIAASSVQDIEEFLGYQISADILENLDDRIRAVLDNMSEDELFDCEKKFLNKEENTMKDKNSLNHEKEFKVNATLYLPVNAGNTVEELIDRLLMMIDPDLQVQIYENTAEIYDI